MKLACDNGRMPWPCRLAWGIALIACIAVTALAVAGLRGGPDHQPIKETFHAQP